MAHGWRFYRAAILSSRKGKIWQKVSNFYVLNKMTDINNMGFLRPKPINGDGVADLACSGWRLAGNAVRVGLSTVFFLNVNYSAFKKHILLADTLNMISNPLTVSWHQLMTDYIL